MILIFHIGLFLVHATHTLTPGLCVALLKQKGMKHKNYKERAMLVKAIVDEHYEPHSQRNCMYDIFLRYVCKVYPMSVRTFYRMMKYAIGKDGFIGKGGNREERPKITEDGRKEEDPRQLKFPWAYDSEASSSTNTDGSTDTSTKFSSFGTKNDVR